MKPRFWIEHPACQGEPVSLRRWLSFKIGEWMQWKGRLLESWALYQGDPDEIPF